MTFGQVAGFFLDSCVLLPHSLETTHQACSNFLKEGKDYFISSSIKQEALDLLLESYSIICTALRSNLKPALEKNGTKTITNRDGVTIANAFSEQKRQIVIQLPTRSNVRNELIGVIENYVANQVHLLKDGVAISVDTLLASAFAELEKARYSIEKPFKTTRTVFVLPHDDLVSMPLLKALVESQKDIPHIASAIQYQFQQNVWVIFVTNDEKHLIFNQKEIWENFGLQCCKPNWALDYSHAMSRLKSPREYYRDILIPTKQQREFAAIIQKIIGISIVRKPYSLK